MQGCPIRTTWRSFQRRPTIRSASQTRSRQFSSTSGATTTTAGPSRSPSSRTTKTVGRRKFHTPPSTPTVRTNHDTPKRRNVQRFSSRKPFFRTTTFKSMEQTLRDVGVDQTLESSNQQSLEKNIQDADDTTKLGDLATALNELQKASVRPRNVSRSYNSVPTPNNVQVVPVRSKLISTTLAPVYPTTSLPTVYVPTTALTPVYTTAFVVRQQQPRPFEKVVQQPQPLYHPTSGTYDYYDDGGEARIVSELPAHSKVLLHSSGIIQCLDQGNFPHPASCRKFIYCAKIDNGDFLGWEYTCPKGLSFDPIGGICNWSAGLGCEQ